jgi:hypothetical protein
MYTVGHCSNHADGHKPASSLRPYAELRKQAVVNYTSAAHATATKKIEVCSGTSFPADVEILSLCIRSIPPLCVCTPESLPPPLPCDLHMQAPPSFDAACTDQIAKHVRRCSRILSPESVLNTLLSRR